MDNTRLDLGVVAALRAEAFGQPGARTFRLHITAGEGTISLWLEKEQLVMLGSALGEVLEKVPSELGEEPTGGPPNGFVGDLEVHAGALTIGYDADHAAFSMEASDFVSPPFALASISFSVRRSDFASLSEEIESIVAAGRPRCNLCGTPLSGGPHFCPPSNGHAEVTSTH